jgi:pyridoxamine 5'-phosphate oxidase
MQDPLSRFKADRQAAWDAKDPMAAVCVLATVDSDGLPQARTLVLRDIADGSIEGLAIYINASSPKWQQSQGRVAIQTWWPATQIQYRMQVSCKSLPAEHIAESWQLRPDPPKRMDWLYQQYPQGSQVKDRQALLNLLENTALPEPLVAPEGAKGLLLQPDMIERLDLTQSNGVHDRVRYLREGDHWQQQTLVP